MYQQNYQFVSGFRDIFQLCHTYPLNIASEFQLKMKSTDTKQDLHLDGIYFQPGC